MSILRFFRHNFFPGHHSHFCCSYVALQRLKIHLLTNFGLNRITPRGDRGVPPSDLTPQIWENAKFEHEAVDLACPYSAENLLGIMSDS